MIKKPAPIQIEITLSHRRKTPEFDPGSNVAADDLRAQLEARLKKYTSELSRSLVVAQVAKMNEVIVANIEADLLKFATAATRFFFSRRASEAPQLITAPAAFNLKDVANPGAQRVTMRHRPTTDSPLIWLGLSKSTMRHKSYKEGPGATTYFIYNDVLRQEMGRAFGTIVGELFEPYVTFVRSPARDPTTGRFVVGGSVGKIKVRVFRSAGGIGPFQAALNSGSWVDAGADQSLITQYLSALTAAKLNNYAKAGGHTREITNRPWVGPSIAYWLIHRMPTVVTNAIERALMMPL